MQTLASLPAWPDGADVAVALTFDVDGQAPWLSETPENTRRLTILSQGQFGPVRGLSRILAMLDETGIPATFYVPGYTAEHHPEAMAAILERGHEVAHHGYMHAPTDPLDEPGQRAELERGLEALDRYGGPAGRIPFAGLGADPGNPGPAGQAGLPVRLQPDGRRPAVLGVVGRAAAARAARALEPVRPAAVRVHLAARRRAGRPGRGRAGLAGRVRLGPARPPGGDLHHAPGGDRPRLLPAGAGAGAGR